MAQATCRLPPSLENPLSEAVDEAGVFRSDLVRRALVLYMAVNPDELEAFAKNDVPGRFRLRRVSYIDKLTRILVLNSGIVSGYVRVCKRSVIG